MTPSPKLPGVVSEDDLFRPRIAPALLFLLAPVLLPASGQGQEEIRLSSKATEITLTGRVQLQARTSSCSQFPFEDDGAPLGSPCTAQVQAVDVFLRRVRLAAEITVNDFVSGKVEPDFGDVDGVELKDAWGRLTFSDAAKLQIGQFKRPFDGFELTSSSKLLTVERDVDIPGVPGLRAASLSEFTEQFNLSSRDIGVMFFGSLPEARIEYWAGVFNGEPSDENEDANSDKQYVARFRYTFPVSVDLPGTGSLPVALATAAAWTDRPFPDPADQPGTRLGGEYFSAYELWAEVGDFGGGPHLQAGLLLGENPTENEQGLDLAPSQPMVGEFATMRAWQMVGTYKLPVHGTRFLEFVEPAFRVTRAEPNTNVEDDENWAFTPGFTVFFHGRNKLQLSWDFVTFSGDTFAPVNSFKSLFQVYF